MVSSAGSGVGIRRATTADASAIASVHVRAWQQAYAHLLPADRLASLDVAGRAGAWRRVFDEGATDVWVAESPADSVIGWASTSAGRGANAPRPLELEGIYVLAETYGSGVGQALLDSAIGENPAFLWVAADNSRSHAFYRRNRFLPDGAAEVYPLLGVDVDVVRLAR